MALTQVSSGGIKDGSITNADLDSSAAIDGGKVSPDFGSQNIVTTGTASAGALIPSGSSVPTNGVYLPAANSVAISTNGTGRLYVNSSGNIGIGTPSAGVRLGGTCTSINGASQSSIELLKNGASAGEIYFYGPDNNFRIGNFQTGGFISFATNGATERLRIDSSGRLLLGTSASVSGSTSHNLQVASNAGGYLNLARSDASVGTGSIIGRIGGYSYGGSTYDLVGQIDIVGDGTHAAGDKPTRLVFSTTAASTASPTERLRITSDGKLGLGTSAPRGNVEISKGISFGSSADQSIYIGASNVGSAVNDNASLAWKIGVAGNASGQNLSIASVQRSSSTNVENTRLTLTTTGLGIGTTPSQLLHLSSTGFPTFRVTDADNGTYFDITNSDGDIILKADEGNAFANSAIRFMVDSGEKLRITNTGALGLSGTNYGSSGQVLTSQGSGAAPQWADGGGGLVLLSTINASSAVNSVDFTSGFSSSYNDYLITINNYSQNVGEFHFQVSTNGGSTWNSNQIYYWTTALQTGGASLTTEGRLKSTSYTSASSNGIFAIHLYGFFASTPKLVMSYPMYLHSGSITYQRVANYVNETGNVNAFRLKAEGANTISGTFKLYGVTKQ